MAIFKWRSQGRELFEFLHFCRRKPRRPPFSDQKTGQRAGFSSKVKTGEDNMKRAILISTAAVLTLTIGAGSAMAFGKDRMGGHHGPRGPMFNFEEVDANSDGKITPEEIAAHAKARFDEQDANGDGALSAEEITAFMQAKQAERMTKRAKHMIVDRDANDDGVLSFEEMQPMQKGRMFDRLDADEDGAISAEEFAKLQKRMERHGYGEGKMMRHGEGFGPGKGQGQGQSYGAGQRPMPAE
jgi:Ca2+-binding EF-hand superfamily protein